MRSALRFSILELIAFLLVPGLGIAAVKAGGIFVTLALLAGMVGFMGFLIAAVFARSNVRRFAGGFVIAAGAYGGLLLYFGGWEFDPAGQLPTTRLLKPFNEAITTEVFVDAETGAALPPEEAAAAALKAFPSASPDPVDFYQMGHLLIGLLLGYLGGKLAMVLGYRPDASATH